MVTPDKFHDECAVFGIYGHKEASNLTYLGLYALQHRGQEASGIVRATESTSTPTRVWDWWRIFFLNGN